MYSNRARITGLSGIDTESMVQQLMQAESMKYTNLKKQQEVLTWKQEIYRDKASKLQSFQDKFLSLTSPQSMRLTSTFGSFTSNIKVIGSGDESKAASVTATGTAKERDYTLKIFELAQKESYKSANSTVANELKSTEPVDISKLKAGDTLKFTLDGVSKTITIDERFMSLSDAGDGSGSRKMVINEAKFEMNFQMAINEAFNKPDGTIKVNYEKTGGKISSLAFDPGAGHELKIFSGSSLDDSETDPISNLGFTSGSSSLNASDKTVGQVFGQKLDDLVASGDIKFDEDTEMYSFTIAGKKISFSKDDSLKTLVSNVNNSQADVTMVFDNISGSFTLSAKEEGKSNGIKNISDGALKLFGFDGADAKHTIATDAVFEINGIKTTRDTNTFEYDGISITLNEVTVYTDEEGNKVDNTIEISMRKDNSSVKDLITEFVKEYNELIADLNDEVNSKRPRSGKYSYYEPLTDEEKSAMSDKEVEKWEEKAKTGLLSRDDLLSGITSSMRSALYQKVEISSGVYLSLFDIGITTSDSYADQGKLVIDEDKLNKALEERGEDLMTLFTQSSSEKITGHTSTKIGLAERLNNIVEGAIGRSNGSIRNRAGIDGVSLTTNKIYKEYQANADKLSDLLNYLADKEDYYYSMFSKMENAIMQNESQMSYLQSMLGM